MGPLAGFLPVPESDAPLTERDDELHHCMYHAQYTVGWALRARSKMASQLFENSAPRLTAVSASARGPTEAAPGSRTPLDIVEIVVILPAALVPLSRRAKTGGGSPARLINPPFVYSRKWRAIRGYPARQPPPEPATRGSPLLQKGRCTCR